MRTVGVTETAAPSPLRRPLLVIVLAWMAGVLLGSYLSSAGAWLLAAAVLSAVTLTAAALRRDRAARSWGMLAVVAVAAAWIVVRVHYTTTGDLRQFIGNTSQLAQVTGTIEGPSYLTSPQRGAFGRFSYKSPATLLILNVDSIRVGERDQRARGRLLLKIEQADHRLRGGDRIRATGWMSAHQGPVNPGERDYRALMLERGILGRLVLRERENWQPLGRAAGWPAIAAVSQELSDRAEASLRLGMSQDRPRLALLNTLLLGRRSPDLAEIDDDFRRTGLSHLLSISGAHLSILLGFVWLIASMLIARPARAAVLVMVVLALYLLTVPPQVPLTRAGIMAATFCIGFGSGRRVRGLDMLALAGLLVLIWRPSDLFDAGCQLSFLGVASLLIFTRPVSLWLWREPFEQQNPTQRRRTRRVRWVADYVAANIVAWALSLPVVAYHFGMVSPLAALLSLVSLPVVTFVLSWGFVKVIAGLVLPSFGGLMARPLEWATDALLALVEHAARAPGVCFELAQPPSVAWTVAAIAVMAALFTGWFARRRLPLAAAVLVCTGWLIWPDAPRHALALWHGQPQLPTMSINMFGVGDGSCFLVRLNADGGGAPPHVLMFDCGSQEYLDVGTRSIAPALRTLGIGRIDTLVISHADMDHYCGSIDTMDEVPVGRVLVAPHLLAEARAVPVSATAELVRAIEARGVPLVEVSRGWGESVGGSEVEMLWPPSDLKAQRSNDTSLVLSVRAAGRRVILNGDIQQQAVSGLLDAGGEKALKTDITDLPHHGGFADASPRWLRAVSPSIALQSCGPARLYHDRWSEVFAASTITRLITERQGMVQVDVDADGRITWSAFKGGGAIHTVP